MAKLLATPVSSDNSLYRPASITVDTTIIEPTTESPTEHDNLIIPSDDAVKVINNSESDEKCQSKIEKGDNQDDTIDDEISFTEENVECLDSKINEDDDRGIIDLSPPEHTVDVDDQVADTLSTSDDSAVKSKQSVVDNEIEIVSTEFDSNKAAEDKHEQVSEAQLSFDSSQSSIEDIDFATKQLNDILIATNSNNASSVGPEETAEYARASEAPEVVVILDESPPQPAASSKIAVNSESNDIAAPVITEVSNPSIPASQINIISLPNAVPNVQADSIADLQGATNIKPVTSIQQSFLQKLIPSLINLNKQQTVANTPQITPNQTTSSSTGNPNTNIQTFRGGGPSAPISSKPHPPSLSMLLGGVRLNNPAVNNKRASGVVATSSIQGSTPAKTSNGIITIDDDEGDDLVVTQVIKPKTVPPAASPAAPIAAPPPRTDNLTQLASKIKSMVDPNASTSNPKLKQLQQTLAALIKNQSQSRIPPSAASSSSQRPELFQQHHTRPPQQPQHMMTSQHSSMTSSSPQSLQQQQQNLPQKQLQALLQQAIANRSQAQAPAQFAPNQQQQQRHLQQQQPVASSSRASAPPNNSSTVVQQILQAVMGKQIQIPQQQQQQQHHNPLQQQQRILQKHQQQQQQPKLIPHNQGQQHSGPVAPNNHPSPQKSLSQNENLMMLENALKGLNPHLAANLKTLQEQLKSKNSNPTDIKSELTTIISNILRMRNAQQQSQGSHQTGKPLKSPGPSLRRQIQTAHRPKQQPHKQTLPANYHQLRRPANVPLIDLSQTLPVVNHSKEKIQFLGVVGLITRQEHQRILLSHPNRKRRIEEARNVLQSEDIQDITDMDKRTRKRRRKNDDGYDGDAHNNYCSKCRMAGELLMCDKCPRVFHLFCLDPPLKQVPDGEWFCGKCKVEKDAEESMDVNVIDIMEDPEVDQESRNQIEELRRQLMETKRVRIDLESDTTDVT